uniref:RNase H type-1 domain-containing protein n=1 Tax=Nicotiana tabacum TaxID=4097 RepID=A0A1S4CU32_TOBAC|nr:PREDICTED: uncharacterized protein LOC107822596 [Nicotiana tabacum]
MLEAREEVEHEILWVMNRGSTNVWHENWTGLGALYHVLPPEVPINEELEEVLDLRTAQQWNDELLNHRFPEDIAEHIRQEVPFYSGDEFWDIPRWMPTQSGKFSVSSAWRIMRHREPTNPEFSKEESFQHLFLTSKTATKVWETFLQAARLMTNMVQVHQVIRVWWNAKCCPKLRPIFQAAPAVILWEIWKRRNTRKHGGSVSCSRVIHEVNKTLYYLAKVRYPWLQGIPMLWPEMIRFFENYKPVVVTRRVTWTLPYDKWYKCNTDGASRGNPGPSSYGFCVRDDRGDLVYAKAREIGETTNIVAEAKGMMEELIYCMEQQLHPLIMETDSLVMKNIIDDEWETPWCIGTEVRKIKEIKESYNVLFQHVYREGNKVADFLANHVFFFAGTVTFQSFHELPSEGKALINMDKAQIPNLRVRIAKRRAPD